MKSISWFLVISYFDQVIGPSILYCNKELNEVQHIELDKLLDFNSRENCIILANDKYQTINFSFLIKSEDSRGGFEQVLLSYIIKEDDIKSEYLDIFKFLRSKQPILQNLANELKKLRWLPKLLSIKNKPTATTILKMASQKDQYDFLGLYNKYCNLLFPEVSRFENEEWQGILIECPFCNKQRKIKIPLSKINKSPELTTILIPKFKLCEHSFLFLVDNALTPKKYEYIDIIVSDIETENLDIQEIDLLLAENIHEYIKKIGINKPLIPRRIIKYLYNVLNLKVNKSYLYYLCEIVKEYFKIEIIWTKTQVLDDLEELWGY
ncbi:MAG: hypothetical protein KGD66_02125 [Candidatus Lokiarchaeota archaeon]|nr:hypothetical protein [Candidatus Lokiarchaeota archaeon]